MTAETAMVRKASMNPLALMRSTRWVASFVLAYALTWWMPLLHFSPLIGLVSCRPGVRGDHHGRDYRRQARASRRCSAGRSGGASDCPGTSWRWACPRCCLLATAGLSVVFGTGFLQFGQLWRTRRLRAGGR